MHGTVYGAETYVRKRTVREHAVHGAKSPLRKRGAPSASYGYLYFSCCYAPCCTRQAYYAITAMNVIHRVSLQARYRV